MVRGLRVRLRVVRSRWDPYAVVPADDYNSCLVLRFDPASGRVVAEAAIEAAPAVIDPVHHPDGSLLPAADGTWLAITPTTIKRCRTIRA